MPLAKGRFLVKLSSLARVLSAGMPTADFVREIEPELAEYLGALAKRGGVAQVRVEQDHPLVFDHAGLATLCSRFAAGDLTTEQLAYVADAILLADRVTITGDDVLALLSECTDPGVNGPLTPQRALQIAASLRLASHPAPDP